MRKKVFSFLLFVLFSFSLHADDWFAYITLATPVANNEVIPLNLTTNVTGTPIPLAGFFPTSIAITPNAQTALVYLDTRVIPIDIPTNTQGTPIAVGGALGFDLAITPDGTTAFVTVTGTFSLTKIDLSTNTATLNYFNFGVNNQPFGIVITPDNKFAYIAIGDGTGSLGNSVVKLDLATNTLVGLPIFMGKFPSNMAITPDGSKIYVLIPNLDLVVPINTATDTSETPIAVSDNPSQIAITPDGATALISHSITPSIVTPINIATNTPESTIPMNSPAQAIAISPDNNIAYIPIRLKTFLNTITIETLSRGPNIGIGTVGGNNISITPDQAPTAIFSSNVAQEGSASTFDASASFSPVGSIFSYDWDFGDGTTSTTINPIISHTYLTSGSFLVTLRVTNTAGTSTTQTFTGHVVSNNGGPTAEIARFIHVPAAPIPPPPLPPRPPLDFTGVIKENKFLENKECLLKATWEPSPSSNIVLFRIFQNGQVVQEVSATETRIFKTCLNGCKAKGFSIAAVNSANVESRRIPLKVQEPSEKIVKDLKNDHSFD